MKKPLKQTLVIPLVICFLSCNEPSSINNSTSNKNIEKEVAASPIFDVPTLVGKNIDEARKVLGKPTDTDKEPSKLQMKTEGFDEWDNSFEKGGYTLIVTFNPHSRKIIDFFITNDEGGFTETSSLNKICNVQEGSTNYTLQPVKQNTDPSKYTGMKIIPN